MQSVVQSSWKAFDWLWRTALAHGVVLSLMILNVVHFGVPFMETIRPAFLLMAIYYWAIFRPTLLPAPYVFVLCLCVDLITGLTPGLTAFPGLLAQFIVREQRRFLMGQPYLTIWVGFAFTCLGVTALQWGMNCLAAMGWVPPATPFASAMFSIFLFPLIVLPLILSHRMLPGSRSYG